MYVHIYRKINKMWKLEIKKIFWTKLQLSICSISSLTTQSLSIPVTVAINSCCTRCRKWKSAPPSTHSAQGSQDFSQKNWREFLKIWCIDFISILAHVAHWSEMSCGWLAEILPAFFSVWLGVSWSLLCATLAIANGGAWHVLTFMLYLKFDLWGWFCDKNRQNE